jgi:uncharacterized membrane protein YbhN (UPF0104 family)
VTTKNHIGSPVNAEPDTPTSPEPTKSRSGWRRLLHIPTPVIFLASLAVAVVVLWRQGTLSDLGDTARQADTGVLIAASALYLISVIVLCLRWQALVQMAGGRYEPAKAAEALLTSVVVNYAAPKGLAVPTRAALSARDLGLSATAASAVALWDVALDFVALGLMSLAWFALIDRSLLGRIELPAGSYVVGLAVIVLIAVVAIAAISWKRPDLRDRGSAAVREMLTYPSQRPGAALASVGFTIAYWVVQSVVFRLMLEAVGLGAQATWVVVLGLLGLPVLIGMFAPTPGGTGVREALMVVVANAGGLPGAPVLLAAVAYRVALLIAVPVLFVVVRIWREARERTPSARRNAGHD